jgi:Glycosyl transferase family 2.
VKLVIFTIVLDGMPYIAWQYSIFQKLKCDWRWIVIEGAAMNNGSTKWCQKQEGRYSIDGTTDFLLKICDYRQINVLANTRWESKDAMANTAVSEITEPCVLMQVDADEIHTPENIEKIVQLFEKDDSLGAIRMPCRFFVGPRLICHGENCWSNRSFEWTRAWRFEPGMRFLIHEPPNLHPLKGRIMEKDEAKTHGLSFDHYAYALKKQVKYKEAFYGYTGLVNQWRSLQKHDHFPEQLNRFFPFVDDKVMVGKI